jgi:WD40 repeat protein/tRNA A-37 threonylcarbamoyl transferase component Bud32
MPTTCKKCGAPLAGTATRGFCARCLLSPLAKAPPGSATSASGVGVLMEKVEAGPAPQFIGGYELVGTIAEGGMGVVYKARDRRVHRTVALKMILGGRGTGEAVLKRFRMEAEAAAALDHPHIVPIYEVGEMEGQPFFTMKLIEGSSLAGRLARFQQDPRASAKLMATVARAIHHAHQRGILHRDLKPANILLNEKDEPFVTDFGLARRFEEASDLTHTGTVMGTPNYMSPEQAGGNLRELTTAADIFSLGAILYHLLAGVAPFRAETVLETLRQVQEREPMPPRKRNPQVGQDLETICLKCLEKNPQNRYRSALELAEDLERWLADETIMARRSTPSERAMKWVRRKPVVAALAAAVIVVGIGGVVGVFLQWRRAETARGIAVARGNAEARAKDEAVRSRSQAEAAYRDTAGMLTRIELEKADVLLAQGDSAGGLAYLARVVRRDPSNVVAASRILSYLNRHAVPVPEVFTIPIEGRVIDAAVSPDRKRVAVTLDRDHDNLRIWSLQAGVQQLPPMTHPFDLIGLGGGSGAGMGPPGMGPPGMGPPGMPPGGFPSGKKGFPGMKGFGMIPGGGGPPMPIGMSNLNLTPLNVGFSPDGKRIVTSSNTRKARVWDSQTGQPVTPFLETGFNTGVEARFYAAEDAVVTVSRDGRVQFWEATTGKMAGEFMTAWGASLAELNAATSQILVAHLRGQAQVWDLSSGNATSPVVEHPGPVRYATWSRNGAVLATASETQVFVWGSPGRNQTVKILEHPAPVTSMAVSPDGRLMVTGCADQKARWWDLAGGELLHSAVSHPESVQAVVFSHDGRHVATLARDNVVRLWAAASAQPACEPLVPHGMPLSVHFTEDDRSLVVLCRDGTICVGTVVRPPDARRPLAQAARVSVSTFSADGRKLLTGSEDGMASLWDIAGGQRSVGPLNHGAPILQAGFSPDHATILTAGTDQVVKLWDAKTGEPRAKPMRQSSPILLARFSVDGRRVMVLTTANLGRSWDAATGEAASPEHDHITVRHAALSADDQVVLVEMGIGRAAVLYDFQTGERLGAFMKHADPLGVCNFSPDGKTVITSSQDNTARLWDGRSGQPISDSLRHNGGVHFAGFSSDGRQAVTTSQDKTARLWNVRGGATLMHTLDHPAGVRVAEFSRDGGRLLTIVDNRTVHVWDTQSGQRIAEPLEHAGNVLSAHFAPDGQTVVTSSQDQGTQIWSVPELPTPAPAWVADLAEMIGGSRIDAKGLTQPAVRQSAAALRARIFAAGTPGVYLKQVTWLFGAPESAAH